MTLILSVIALVVLWALCGLMFWVLWHHYHVFDRSVRHASPLDEAWLHRDLERDDAHGDDPQRSAGR